MALKLYGLPYSTSSARVLFCLYEKQADFELIPVDLMTGEHNQPAFLAKNPFGQLPALEEGDLTLFESRAITAYVAEKFKDTGSDLLRHSNPKEAALVKVWLEVESQSYDPAIAPIFFQHFIAPIRGQSTDQSVIDANLEKLEKVLDVYQARLSKTKYLAGDFYSLADLHHLACTHYLMKTPYAKVINERPRVKTWWEDISSRPASKKVTEGMTLGVLPKYFNSELSVAQFRLLEGSQYMVAFGHEKNTVVILGMDGSFFGCQFNPVNGGEKTQLEYHNFLKPEAAF